MPKENQISMGCHTFQEEMNEKSHMVSNDIGKKKNTASISVNLGVVEAYQYSTPAIITIGSHLGQNVPFKGSKPLKVISRNHPRREEELTRIPPCASNVSSLSR